MREPGVKEGMGLLEMVGGEVKEERVNAFMVAIADLNSGGRLCMYVVGWSWY